MKSLFTRITIIMAVITAVIAAESCTNTIDAKELAKVNRCPYEGNECPNAQQAIMDCEREYHDYQIELYMDTVWVYDSGRLVGSYISKESQPTALDSILIKDNE